MKVAINNSDEIPSHGRNNRKGSSDKWNECCSIQVNDDQWIASAVADTGTSVDSPTIYNCVLVFHRPII